MDKASLASCNSISSKSFLEASRSKRLHISATARTPPTGFWLISPKLFNFSSNTIETRWTTSCGTDLKLAILIINSALKSFGKLFNVAAAVLASKWAKTKAIV